MNPLLSFTAAGAVEKAYQHIKARIISLELKPRERLRAQEIAAELALSRTPVREALARLEHEGLVVREGGWGYSVRGISVKEATDLFAVRQSLEMQVVREVLPHVSQQLLDKLSDLLQEQETALSNGRIQDFRKKSRAFHLLILAATQNDILQTILSSIDDRVRLIGAIIHEARGDRAREVLSENKSIFESLRDHDESKALCAVQDHLARAKDIAITYMIAKGSIGRSEAHQKIVNN